MPINTSTQQFIHETISEWAVETLAILQMQITKKGIILKGDLLRSLSYKVVKEAAGAVRYELSFKEYGRILDMSRHKVKPRKINRTITLGGKEVKVRRRSVNSKWYSKQIFKAIYSDGGLYSQIINNYKEWALRKVVAALEG